jgi:hypothetical protein
MTTRRRLLVFGLLAGALALGGGIWLLWPRQSAITLANAVRIHGMTRQEVENILGRPTTEIRNGESPILMAPYGPWDSQCEWNSPEFVIVVAFDKGRVSEVESGAHVRETILERVRRWFGL